MQSQPDKDEVEVFCDKTQSYLLHGGKKDTLHNKRGIGLSRYTIFDSNV